MKQENLSVWKTRLLTIASILSWTILVLLIAIALFLAYVGVSSKIYAVKGSNYEPKFSLYTIVSPSMKPNLNVYDTIIDKRVDSMDSIKIGDVITFISSASMTQGMTITHRVKDIIIDEDGKRKFKTQGDNNLIPDPPYAEEANILRRVIIKIQQIGRVQFFLAKKGGWLLIVVVPAIIVLIRYVLRLVRLLKVEEKVETSLKSDDDRKKKKTNRLYKP